MNKNESKELLKLSKQHKAKVLIDFEWRFTPARQKVKELIVNHKIGEIIHFDYHISSAQYNNLIFNKRGWMGEKQKFGGMLGALGTHMLDCFIPFVLDDMDFEQDCLNQPLEVFTFEQIIGYVETFVEKGMMHIKSFVH